MPHLLTPNVNFIPGSRIDVFLDAERSALRWDMEHLNEVTQAAGYDGIELHDSKLFQHSRQLHTATPEEAQKLGRLIVTMHESWVDAADPQPRNPDMAREPEKGSLAMRIGSRLIFPTGSESLENHKTLETKLGRRFDHILYPDVHGDPEVDRFMSRRFSGRVAIQPTIDVAAAWGVDSPEGFADELERRKLKAVWNHFHGDRRGKIVDGRMEQAKYLPVLLQRGLVHAVHFGLYRIDFKKVDQSRYTASVNEGVVLADNSDLLYRYPIADTFDLLREYNWQGNMTIEAPLSGMEAAHKATHASRKLTQKEIVERHHSTSQAIRAHLPHIELLPVTT